MEYGVFVFLKLSFPKDMAWANKSSDNYTFSVGYYSANLSSNIIQ